MSSIKPTEPVVGKSTPTPPDSAPVQPTPPNTVPHSSDNFETTSSPKTALTAITNGLSHQAGSAAVPENEFTPVDDLSYQFRRAADPTRVAKVKGEIPTETILIVVHPINERFAAGPRVVSAALKLMDQAARAGIPSLVLINNFFQDPKVATHADAVSESTLGEFAPRFRSNMAVFIGGNMNGCLDLAIRYAANSVFRDGQKTFTVRLVPEGIYDLVEDRPVIELLSEALKRKGPQRRNDYLETLAKFVLITSNYGKLNAGTSIVLIDGNVEKLVQKGASDFTLRIEIVEAESAFAKIEALPPPKNDLHFSPEEVARFVADVITSPAEENTFKLNDTLTLVYHPADPERKFLQGKFYIELKISDERALIFKLAVIFTMLEKEMPGIRFSANLSEAHFDAAALLFGEINAKADAFKRQLYDSLVTKVPELFMDEYEALTQPVMDGLRDLMLQIAPLYRLVDSSEGAKINGHAALVQAMHDLKNDIGTVPLWDTLLRETIQIGDGKRIEEEFQVFFRTLTLPHEIKDILSSVYARFLPLAQGAAVDLEMRFDPNDAKHLEFTRRVDAEAFLRILGNLVKNGIIHRNSAPEKRGLVKVSFMVDRAREKLIVEVSDDGYGMSDIERASYGLTGLQGDRAVAAGTTGSGKGSASVLRLLRILEGKIENIVSTPEKGTSIVISIPLSHFEKKGNTGPSSLGSDNLPSPLRGEGQGEGGPAVARARVKLVGTQTSVVHLVGHVPDEPDTLTPRPTHIRTYAHTHLPPLIAPATSSLPLRNPILLGR